MKYLFLVITAVTFCNITFSQATLTTAQRKIAADYLSQTKKDFLQSIDGLNASQLHFKKDSATWSILECAEHIALAEQGIFYIAQEQLKQPADSLKRKEIKVDEKEIIGRITNRSSKAQSPEMIKPSGKFADIAAIKQAFEKQRDNCINYTNTTTDELHYHYWMHPATGTIDIYQAIILMAAHTKRHTLQIEEVKTNAAYPK